MPSVDDRGVGPCKHWYQDDGRCWYCGRREGDDEGDTSEIAKLQGLVDQINGSHGKTPSSG
jgi:hypothetical protein